MDNNLSPTAVLNELNFVQNQDTHAGIPIHFRILDEESDEVRVVVQWAGQGEAFATLPTSREAILSIVDDPRRMRDRRALQICSEMPVTFEGLVGGSLQALNADEIRLPTVAGTEAGLLGYALNEQYLELLRPSSVPAELVWPTNPLNGPVSAVAGDTATSAFVLDEGDTGWQVRDIDLATGVVLRNVASGLGASRTMTLAAVAPPAEQGSSVDQRFFYVATDAELFRLSYPSGDSAGCIPYTALGGVRQIAVLGSDVVIGTNAMGLLRFDFATMEEPVLLAPESLQDPYGVVVDPLRRNHVYVSEMSANRVVSLDLQTLVTVPVPAKLAPGDAVALGPMAFPNPRALALEGNGRRMLVACESSTGLRSLRAVDLRNPEDGGGATGDGPFVFQIVDQLADSDGDLLTGEDGLRVLAQPSIDSLFVGGGVQQQRALLAIDPYDAARQVLTVEEAFDPLPVPGTP
ncbi:MAG: hypothetical protein AAGG01_23990, partial [Planctomycetota bacterium]